MTKNIDDKLDQGQREDAPGTTTRQGGQPSPRKTFPSPPAHRVPTF